MLIVYTDKMVKMIKELNTGWLKNIKDGTKGSSKIIKENLSAPEDKWIQ